MDLISVMFVIQQIYRRIAIPYFIEIDGRAKEIGHKLGHGV